MADWDDDDPSVLPETVSKWDKVVILKHMFTLRELEVKATFDQFPLYQLNDVQDDPAAMLEIKEDIREECAKLGEVTNVVLFDKEPDGVASVRFANAQAAETCVRVRHDLFLALDTSCFTDSEAAHGWPVVRRETTQGICCGWK